MSPLVVWSVEVCRPSHHHTSVAHPPAHANLDKSVSAYTLKRDRAGGASGGLNVTLTVQSRPSRVVTELAYQI